MGAFWNLWKYHIHLSIQSSNYPVLHSPDKKTSKLTLLHSQSNHQLLSMKTVISNNKIINLTCSKSSQLGGRLQHLRPGSHQFSRRGGRGWDPSGSRDTGDHWAGVRASQLAPSSGPGLPEIDGLWSCMACRYLCLDLACTSRTWEGGRWLGLIMIMMMMMMIMALSPELTEDDHM